ncbi:WRKY family transcription factor [Hibiscus syriacus]|uniref:WRKY family transcription factor n=1 Tax=Hibiscus syriacus TaxID=106335 RepID=A0A6A3AWW6_HIBSY|nr:probable WRKY transcription factor 41 [Hibiscus syriacus]KAE8708288.1 WRKY family transcription factor [Hibiscus syriacus]
MERRWNWEQGTLVSELIQGLELAKQLRFQLDTSASAESTDLLVQKILSSYEKALQILKVNVGATSAVPGSPLSMNGSPRSDDLDKDNQDTRDVSKKRKMLPRWTDHVRVTCESQLEGTHDDGYSWRKYGQKDILGAKYPRSYYRCSYRHTQDCLAAKQVQRSDEDPTIFEVTYRGAHTCSHGNQMVPPPASPNKQEHKSINLNYNDTQQLQSLLSLRNGLRVDTEGLDNKEMALAHSFSFPSTSFGLLKSENYSFSSSGVLDNNNILSSFPSPFMSPATSELNYFSASQSQTNNFGVTLDTRNSESDLKGLISANTSTTNSPIMDLDFSLDQVELDPNFPFDALRFFS